MRLRTLFSRYVLTTVLAGGLGFALYGSSVNWRPSPDDVLRLRMLVASATDRAMAILDETKKPATAASVPTREPLASSLPPGTVAGDRRGASRLDPDADREVAALEPAGPRPPAELPAPSAACAAPAPAGAGAITGDRIQLRVFERARFDSARGGKESPDQEDYTFERLDLSGSYEVDEAGELALPLLGRFSVASLPLDCVERRIAAQYAEAAQATAVVSANFASRPPVVVNGTVRAPGVYAFTPGMNVAHLLALAGLPSATAAHAPVEHAGLIAHRDEVERRALAVDLERVRLEAARAGRRDLALSDADQRRFTRVLGDDRIDSERAALRAELAALDVKKASHQRQLASLKDQIASIYAHLAGIDAKTLHHAERLSRLQDLRTSGIASLAHLDDTEKNLMLLDSAALTATVEVARLSRSRETLKHNIAIDAANRRERLSLEIRDRIEERDGLHSQRATIEAQLAALLPAYAGQSLAERLRVAIRRPGRKTASLDADPETELAPGDVVTVSIALPEIPRPDPRLADADRDRQAVLSQ